MTIVKRKPTSPGRRFVISVISPDLHKGAPYAPLLEKKSKSGGRNNNGRITSRHIGGGHKQHYRKIDFRRNKDGIPATVERIEYDPNRTANIDRKSTRLNSSHVAISYAVFCLKKKNNTNTTQKNKI